MNKLILNLGNLNRSSKQLIQILSDTTIIILSYYLSFLIRLMEYNDFYESVNFLSNKLYLNILVLMVIFTISGLYISGVYRLVLRFLSNQIIIQIVIISLLSVIFFYVCSIFTNEIIPRSVPILYGLFIILFFISSRFFAKSIFILSNSNKTKILIYGAGEGGRQLLNFLSKESNYEPIAFIDDDTSLENFVINGLKIFQPISINDLIVKENVGMILLAMPSMSRKRRREVLIFLEKFKIKVRTIPNLNDIVSGKSKISELKNIPFEEFLGRETIPPIKELLIKNIYRKNVMVTGAGGSIGSEMCARIMEQKPASLILLDNSEFALYKIYSKIYNNYSLISDSKVIPMLGNVQDEYLINDILNKYSVDTIYHTAAYKHVPLVEINSIEAVKNNIIGTKNILDCAINHKVSSFTLISTDKAVNPVNIMGYSKRFSELVCHAISNKNKITKVSIVRFGNVLGSSGSVIPLFSKQINDGGPITVTHQDVARYFMTIKEASELVIQASAMMNQGQVFILDMGEQIKILDVAKRMALIQGYTPYVSNKNEAGDLEIKIIGLRKGEKLREELYYTNEVSSTIHPRIICAHENIIDLIEIEKKYREIQSALENRDEKEIKNILTSIE